MLTLRGRRTGREITCPVQYAAGQDALWVWPAHPEQKTWWRNLEVESPVRLRLRGRDLHATAVALHGEDEPAEVETGLRAYAARFASPARRAGLVPDAGDGPLLETAKRTTLVRITIPRNRLEEARDATVVRGRGAAAAARRHPLAAFFVLAFAFSWGYWIPVAAAGGRLSHFPGLLGPMLAGLVVGAIVRGRAGSQDLLTRMTRWRVPVRWYAAAAAPAGAGLIALGALVLAGRDVPSLEELASMPGLPEVGWAGVFALVLLVNGYGEEAGWRGFAWPRLRERHTLGAAALMLAVPWAIWHTPLFWIDTGMRSITLVAIPGWLLGLAAGAVVLGWLYERARSSVLVVALFHALLNMASATEGTEGIPAGVVSALVIIWAIVIVRSDGRRRTASAAAKSVPKPPVAEAPPRGTVELAAPSTRPGWLFRRLARVPVWLYRAHLGWLLGNRFLMVTHRGRRTGRIRRTVLEVVRRDPGIPEWVVVSGYGATSDWFRNLLAHPALRIDVGHRRFEPAQRMLGEQERLVLLTDYQRDHPRTARQLGERLLRTTFDGSESSIRALAERLPAVAFRPRNTGAFPDRSAAASRGRVWAALANRL
ncbi:MAG TPA: nitroreductase family deazaflavin-dependent oxidoreductase [Actinomycetes bacterium]|nr:nitroreductase family deazaflavin-dependent oxidoreductase [Actinomycetes bacterium]